MSGESSESWLHARARRDDAPDAALRAGGQVSGGLVPGGVVHTAFPWEFRDDQGVVGKLSGAGAKL